MQMLGLIITALLLLLSNVVFVVRADDLQVIGAGFPRTATSSLREALNILGYQTYHMQKVRAHKGHMEAWTEYLKGEKELKQTAEFVYQGYTAAVDGPTSTVWEELSVLYPEAKIILTERSSAEKWWESASQTVLVSTGLNSMLFLVHPSWRKFGLLLKYLWYRTFDLDVPRHVTEQDATHVMDAYKNNSERARLYEDKERMLIFQASQGWQPLCAFLDKPVPEVPFPNINDRKEFGRHMFKQAMFLLVPTSLVVAFLAYRIGIRRSLPPKPKAS